METRKIGALDVSVIGLGCNNFGRRIDAEQSAAVVNASLDAGINFFDTADVYGSGLSEEYLGRALRSRRGEVLIATKFRSKMDAGEGASAAYIQIAVEASLRRLNTDVIDLYQIHSPDPNVSIAETLGALNDLVKAGKVREIGSSNFSAEQIREADAIAQANGWARFVSVQNHYSLLHREPEQGALGECERLGLGFLPYFPLASGLLTGKVRKGQPLPDVTRLNDDHNKRWLSDENLTLVEALIAFAEQRGHSVLELAFAWLLARPVVSSVIAGARNAAQVHANAAAGGWQLTDADLAEIDGVMQAAVG
ncbi:MAG: aldo/keto reductase [Anaerolineae bacterium]|nr:aldo/keto reductase [Anaerolineae bacterium]